MNWFKHAPGSPTSLGEPHTESWGPTPTAWHSTTSPTVPPAPPPRTTRCTRRGTTGTQQQRLPTHLLALSSISPQQHNQIKGTPASRQDGTAGQPHHEGTWSVPAQHEPQGMQNVRRKCYTSTRPTEFTFIQPFPHNHNYHSSSLLSTPTPHLI